VVSWVRPRHSAITFDVGAGGLRAYQFQRQGAHLRPGESLHIERAVPGDDAQPAAPVLDPAQLERLIGRGNFHGREVALVLSPPEVLFFPLRVPAQALDQPPERVEQALKWEVAQESRKSGDELEVRFWTLPAGRGSPANVMAVVMPATTALEWCRLLQRHGLTLRRIDVSPCALVRLAQCVWTPEQNDLWGVLDIGLRRSNFTVVAGTTPAYVRVLSLSAHEWTRQLATALQVTYPVAEQLKRQHGLERTERGVRAQFPAHTLLNAPDLPSAFASVLHESLQTLTTEVLRCFSYVLQGLPSLSVKRLFLAGGGAALRGLPAILETELGMPVTLLSTASPNAAPPWAHPLDHLHFDAHAAAVVGGAMLDLEASCAAR